MTVIASEARQSSGAKAELARFARNDKPYPLRSKPTAASRSNR
jgi:hypothetical protein